MDALRDISKIAREARDELMVTLQEEEEALLQGKLGPFRDSIRRSKLLVSIMFS